ncbi:MAG: hypothetical protein ACRYFB_07770 [Janthinobacterium lividum]
MKRIVTGWNSSVLTGLTAVNSVKWLDSYINGKRKLHKNLILRKASSRRRDDGRWKGPKDYEKTPIAAMAFIQLSFLSIILARIS